MIRSVLIAASLVVAGCGQSQMVRVNAEMRGHMLQGNFRAALTTLQAAKEHGYSEQDRVVYWMNEGMLLHLTGKLRQSIVAFEAADRRAEELFTKSIRKQIAATLSSNAAKNYGGEDYERVLLNVMKALNWAAVGNIGNALVEARRINEKLTFYNSRYKKKNAYGKDAFAYWLMGILFELEGSHDNARISFEHALQTYYQSFVKDFGLRRPPSFVAEDLVRAARRSKANDLVARYQKLLKTTGDSAEVLKTQGEIVLFHLNGEGPSKADFWINCIFGPQGSWRCDAEPGDENFRRVHFDVAPKGYTIMKIAYPMLITKPVTQIATLIADGKQATAEPAMPINRIARRTLANKMGRVFADSVKRMVAKMVMQKAAREAGKAAGDAAAGIGEGIGGLAELVVSSVNQATEEADKRAWTTLPGRIDVARLFVRPGKQKVTVRLSDGRITRFAKINVRAGKRTFITFRSLP